MFIKVVISIVFLFAVIAGFYYGRPIAMGEQLPLYEALRNTSAIIFGVMGAWLAILHPSSLKDVFTKNGQVQEKDQNTISLLISPIIISTFILLFVLIIPLFVVASKNIAYFLDHKEFYRGVSFSILCGLSVLQLWTIILTLIPSDILKRTIQVAEAKKKNRNKLFSEAKRRRK